MKHEKKETKSRLAQGLDYLTIRVTIFILAAIAFNQIGINIYGSLGLALLCTFLINRQVRSLRQKRLAKIELKNENNKALDEILQEENKKATVAALKPINFILSAIFLFALGFLLSGWFKYYFYVFSFINVLFAIFSLIKLKQSSRLIKEEGN